MGGQEPTMTFFANIAIIVSNEECLVAMTQPKFKLGKIYILVY
jgi:hypothetical protein